MPEKRLPARADKAVWEKIIKGRAGIRWDMEEFRGRPRKGPVYSEVWRVHGRSKRNNRRKGKASAKK